MAITITRITALDLLRHVSETYIMYDANAVATAAVFRLGERNEAGNVEPPILYGILEEEAFAEIKVMDTVESFVLPNDQEVFYHMKNKEAKKYFKKFAKKESSGSKKKAEHHFVAIAEEYPKLNQVKVVAEAKSFKESDKFMSRLLRETPQLVMKNGIIALNTDAKTSGFFAEPILELSEQFGKSAIPKVRFAIRHRTLLRKKTAVVVNNLHEVAAHLIEADKGYAG